MISDLHLAIAVDKPMDIFGDHWQHHEQDIKKDWLKKVSADDMVLLGGDISWSMKCAEAMIDFAWLDQLPGKKVIIKGNHDYWWAHKNKIAAEFDSFFFLHNNFVQVGRLAICGTKGWEPQERLESEQDFKIHRRETGRLRYSLQKAKEAGLRPDVVMLHYPPLYHGGADNDWTALFVEYGVQLVLYGHIHGAHAFSAPFQGTREGVMYRLTSSDYLNFQLIELTAWFDAHEK